MAHKKVNSLEYLRGDKNIKDVKIKRKLQIDEVFLKKEVEEDVSKNEPSGGTIRKGGNIQKSLQTYKIYYYPPEEGFPTSKVWLYFNRKQGEKILGTKSLCFENVENHRKFIVNNIFSQLYWLEQKGVEFKPEWMDKETYRSKLLEGILTDLRKKILAKVKEESH